MRTLVILTTTLLIFGCSNKDSSNILNETKAVIPKENIQYIDIINKDNSLNENEFYIDLHFLKDVLKTYGYDKIVELTDSLIFQDDDTRRSRFPEILAPKYFDLRGLSKLGIYDKSSEFVSNGKFVRVEYLDMPLDSKFIAVYKSDKKIIAENYYYGISNFSGDFETSKYSIKSDNYLTQNILTKLDEKRGYNTFQSKHVHFSNSDTVLSIVNSASFAYITLSTGNDFKVLYKSSDFENILDIWIIPLTGNKFPHILTRCGKPATGWFWSNLFYYDSKNYKATKSQRIDLNEYKNNKSASKQMPFIR